MNIVLLLLSCGHVIIRIILFELKIRKLWILKLKFYEMREKDNLNLGKIEKIMDKFHTLSPIF